MEIRRRINVFMNIIEIDIVWLGGFHFLIIFRNIFHLFIHINVHCLQEMGVCHPLLYRLYRDT